MKVGGKDRPKMEEAKGRIRDAQGERWKEKGAREGERTRTRG